MGDWKLFRLGDHCTKIGSGATPRGGKDAYLDFGPYALIRSQNVHNLRFDWNGLAYIDDVAAEKLRNVEVRHADVLLNITGDSVARCCRVDADALPARVNQHVAIIRPDGESLDPAFVMYWLASPRVQAQLLALASAGATRNALTKSMIESLQVSAPSVAEQRAIASVLAALDDKIEFNRRMNEALEAMARAMFDEWLLSDVSALPTMTLGEADCYIRKGIQPRYAERSGLRTLNQKVIQSSGLNRSAYRYHDTSAPVREDALIRRGDVAINSTGQGTLGRCYWFHHDEPDVIADGHVTILRSNSEVWLPSFLGYWFTRPAMYGVLNDHATGSTGQTGLGKRALEGLAVPCPPMEQQGRFDATVSPLNERRHLNELESNTLAQLRDTLLPKLLSGEVRVRHAEEIVEAAT